MIAVRLNLDAASRAVGLPGLAALDTLAQGADLARITLATTGSAVLMVGTDAGLAAIGCVLIAIVKAKLTGAETIDAAFRSAAGTSTGATVVHIAVQPYAAVVAANFTHRADDATAVAGVGFWCGAARRIATTHRPLATHR